MAGQTERQELVARFITAAGKRATHLGPDMVGLTLVPVTKANDPDLGERQLRVIMSSEEKDRHGAIVRSSGADLKNFRKNPVLLFGHRHDIPAVGKVLRPKKEKGKLTAIVEFAPTVLGEELLTLYKGGFMKAWSIGFIPIKWDTIDEGGDSFFAPLDIKKWELLELSAVAVGACPQALTDAVKTGTPDDVTREFVVFSKSLQTSTPVGDEPATAIDSGSPDAKEGDADVEPDESEGTDEGSASADDADPTTEVLDFQPQDVREAWAEAMQEVLGHGPDEERTEEPKDITTDTYTYDAEDEVSHSGLLTLVLRCEAGLSEEFSDVIMEYLDDGTTLPEDCGLDGVSRTTIQQLLEGSMKYYEDNPPAEMGEGETEDTDDVDPSAITQEMDVVTETNGDEEQPEDDLEDEDEDDDEVIALEEMTNEIITMREEGEKVLDVLNKIKQARADLGLGQPDVDLDIRVASCTCPGDCPCGQEPEDTDTGDDEVTDERAAQIITESIKGLGTEMKTAIQKAIDLEMGRVVKE